MNNKPIRKQMTFYRWVAMNIHKFEPKEEDIAQDILLDADFPQRSIDRDEIKNYLHERSVYFCMDCFDRMFSKYENRIRGV